MMAFTSAKVESRRNSTAGRFEPWQALWSAVSPARQYHHKSHTLATKLSTTIMKRYPLSCARRG